MLSLKALHYYNRIKYSIEMCYFNRLRLSDSGGLQQALQQAWVVHLTSFITHYTYDVTFSHSETFNNRLWYMGKMFFSLGWSILQIWSLYPSMTRTGGGVSS